MAEGRRLGLVLIREAAEEPGAAEVLREARERGIPVRVASAAVLRRMTSVGPAADVLALVGRDPGADLAASLQRVLEERLARIDGVRDVHNDLRLQGRSPNDERLRSELLRRVERLGRPERVQGLSGRMPVLSATTGSTKSRASSTWGRSTPTRS